jgi:hypothetical protein
MVLLKGENCKQGGRISASTPERGEKTRVRSVLCGASDLELSRRQGP